MEKNSKIYIAGINGMVGSAINRVLVSKGYTNILGHRSSQLDLRNQTEVDNLFLTEKPEYVFLAAAKVGGILANNNYRADFILDNIQIEINIIRAALKHYVTKLLFLGSSCIYPKFAAQPIHENALLTGLLESTNEPYAIAKIAGIKMCEAIYDQYNKVFISVMPTNLYGFGDNYNPENSHVLPALIRKIHQAKINGEKTVTIWGSGMPLREFMFSDDVADACVFLMENYESKELINIGSGQEVTIKDLAFIIAKTIGFNGEFVFDTQKPDGTPRKLMDSSRLYALGWKPNTPLKQGIEMTYKDFLTNNI